MTETTPTQLRQALARLTAWRTDPPGRFLTGIDGVDALLPDGGLARGAVHEILSDVARSGALSFALLVAKAALGEAGTIAWCDPRREIFPFALQTAGIDLNRLLLLRPRRPVDEVWTINECLRCRGVGVVLATPPKLSRVEARRLQLAAERGGGVGVFLRPDGPAAGHYAAVTRWRIEPATGDESVRRFVARLVHGQGGKVGESVLLEVCRETNHVRAAGVVADRSLQTPTTARG